MEVVVEVVVKMLTAKGSMAQVGVEVAEGLKSILTLVVMQVYIPLVVFPRVEMVAPQIQTVMVVPILKLQQMVLAHLAKYLMV